MNGRTSKRLRKEAKYEKSFAVKPAGDYNLRVHNVRTINVPRFELVELTQEQKAIKAEYKELKAEYYASR